MKFKRVERKEYEELLKRKCSICQKQEWTSEIKSDDSVSFECLAGFGCKDGSSLVCDDCFKSHFEEHSWSFDTLFV